MIVLRLQFFNFAEDNQYYKLNKFLINIQFTCFTMFNTNFAEIKVHKKALKFNVSDDCKVKK
ncbi:MAG: hypothetical protein EA412_09070 [Chitinophagaceae bacterium]|nr:MAG: hypothetical protein EA412_09070 [Chitinophagaceae bacterium]